MNFLVELDFDPLSFRKLLRTCAREYEEIWKKQFSGVLSQNQLWENKTYKLKRSITQQFAWIHSDSFLLFYLESKY